MKRFIQYAAILAAITMITWYCSNLAVGDKLQREVMIFDQTNWNETYWSK